MDDVKVQITISQADLARIFDTVKKTQDVYAQLVRVSPEGKEREFARTATCTGGDLCPRWEDERFSVQQAGSKTLVFRVYCEHFWRNDTLCGEVEMDFGKLVAGVKSGATCQFALPLTKKGAATGTLRGSFGLDRGSAAVAATPGLPGRPAPLAVVGGRTPLPSPRRFKAELEKLLNRPEELEERVRTRFRQLAKPVGRDGLKAMQPEDCNMLRELLSEKLGVPAEVFGEIHQMFWRFEVSGEGRLYEDEATRLVLCMLRQYRDSMRDPRTASQQLTRRIKTMAVADKYEIVKELGRGGQGIAYLANSKGATQQVVVKMYAKTNQQEAVEEISQEFELLSTLKHPKIARVFEIFQDWNNVYIVQEPYFGGDLTKAVQNAYNAGVSVDERWVRDVMYQVLQGCEFLHNHGVIHSDLKEPNVMVASHTDWQKPQIIVIDFGLANKFSSKSGVGGTPGYMPPEVWEWGLWTPRGDVFSLGVMLFTLRTGSAPFNPDGRRTIEEVKQLTKDTAPTMDKGSSALRQLVQRMTQKKFLSRPMVGEVMRDPWFQSQDQDQGQALDMQALQALAGQKQRTDLYRALLADVAARQNLAQLRELNETFMRLDVNNDGRISAQELRHGLRGVCPEADVERLVAVLGINSGGEVSYDEFLGELLAVKVPEENALLQQLFNEVDEQRKGYLGSEELLALAKRPAIVKILGSPEAALARIRAMDPERKGYVTFEQFKRAVQGGAAEPSRIAGGRFAKGQPAQYWSTSHGLWMDCAVTAVDEQKGVQVDCKPGTWLPWPQLERHLRAAGGAEPQGYREGQEVLMWSTTYTTWIPCKVTAVDTTTGAVQVDQKPGYWLRGSELATRLKPAPPDWAPAPPPPRDGAALPAVRAGVGRQLLDQALGALGGPGGRVR